MSSEPWSDEENDQIVADYFAMLAADFSGRPYVKAQHNRGLQASLGRSRPSIEFKYRNISAALQGFGEAWLTGYRPAFNYQASLEDAVARWFALNPGWFTRRLPPARAFAEQQPLWIGPAPTLSNQPPPDELEHTLRVARKFDAAGRDERNRTLGRAGEELALAHERYELARNGRPDLARKVRWVSEDEGDGLGYDIASFDVQGRSRLIEVKTTNGWERTPFMITRNELAVADERRDEWCLLRLWNFTRDVRAFELHPPMDRHVSLTATTFEASFC